MVDKETKKSAIQLASASSIGIAMAIAIFGCLFLGIWLDRTLGTKPYLTLLFLLMGIAAGFRNIYLLTKRTLKNEKSAAACGKSEPNGKRPPSKKA
ncbi:MAG: hypothetical protein A2Z43_02480 [Syntrophobacterales bacterium RBG_19FT_COMBO_59_10]|nr:MAG: hypothetical protein A2Z43_02480 [Syntrophobacterales bacterium RBG_19FT_COMBO_59_10]